MSSLTALVWSGTTIMLAGIAWRIPTADDHAAMQEFVHRLQQGRRHPSALALSYLRGKTYWAEKQRRRDESRTQEGATDHNDRLETAQWLAVEFRVGEAAIRNNGQLAKAVDVHIAAGGDPLLELLLVHARGLTRKDILWLAQLPLTKQRQRLQDLLQTSRWSGRSADNKKPSTITLPREPRAFLSKARQRLKAHVLAAIRAAFLADSTTEAP